MRVCDVWRERVSSGRPLRPLGGTQVPSVAFPPKGHPDSACTTPGAESPPSREEARRVSEPAEPCTACLVTDCIRIPCSFQTCA